MPPAAAGRALCCPFPTRPASSSWPARLAARGVEILSTGGTARLLRGARLAGHARSPTHTGFPEIMDGRVKTLHPKIHGGLLGRRGIDDAVMAEHGIAPIDLLVVNLYPVRADRSRSPDCSYEEAIENIDIGGPAMLRAAAKNHAVGARWSSIPPTTRGVLDELQAQPAATSRLRARSSPPRPSPTPRATTPWWPATSCTQQPVADESFPEHLAGWSSTRSSGPALRREPAPARRVLHAIRRRAAASIATRAPAAGQGTLLQQHRRCRRGARVRAAVRRAAPA